MSRSSKKPGPAKRVQHLNEWIKSVGFDKKRKVKKEDNSSDILNEDLYMYIGKPNRKKF